jgi:hypothetical protein
MSIGSALAFLEGVATSSSSPDSTFGLRLPADLVPGAFFTAGARFFGVLGVADEDASAPEEGAAISFLRSFCRCCLDRREELAFGRGK